MSAEQQTRALVPGDADEQLRIIGVHDIGGQHGVVGGFLPQLVGFAGEQPYERVEPEHRRRDAGEQQLDPVHASDVGKLVRNNRFRFAGSFDGAIVEQDHWAHQSPADRR